jgi:mannose-1-phosphate guanylyltransferase/phosphomannomutase
VNVTSAVEEILGEDAVVRTKLASASLMEAAVLGVTFAGASDGGCIWPDFLPAYDAAVTLVKLLDLLAQVDRPLSTVCAALPAVHVAHETIVTPWERKGTVMREIVENVSARTVELVDGVKVIEDGRWALVLPDPEDALTHVWAEAGSDQDARRLAQEYVQRIRQILR